MTDPPSRGEIGRILRAERDRQQPKLSAATAAHHLGISQTGLTRYENGQLQWPERVIDGLCDLYGVDPDQRAHLLSGSRERRNSMRPPRVVLHRPGDAADRQQDIGEREEAATRITTLGHVFIPGLLQTERYMRAVIAGGGLEPARRDTWIANRVARQRIVGQPGRDLVQIVTGPALVWAAESSDLMAEQIDRLVADSQRPGVHLGVIPPLRPVDVFPMHGIDLYENPDGTRTAIVGTLAGTQILDDEYDIARHGDMLDRLAEIAEWGSAAREELGRVRAWYENGERGKPRRQDD